MVHKAHRLSSQMVMSEPYDSTQILTVSHLYSHQTKPEGQGTKSSVNFWKATEGGYYRMQYFHSVEHLVKITKKKRSKGQHSIHISH